LGHADGDIPGRKRSGTSLTVGRRANCLVMVSQTYSLTDSYLQFK
jgi:hypothetical protein